MMASAGAVLSGIMWLQQLHDHRWVAPVPYGPRPRSNAQPNRPSIDYATALPTEAIPPRLSSRRARIEKTTPPGSTRMRGWAGSGGGTGRARQTTSGRQRNVGRAVVQDHVHVQRGRHPLVKLVQEA